MSTRFGRKPGGYIWALLDPAAYIIMLSLVFSIISHSPPLGHSFPLFYATGYIGYQFYSAMAHYLNDAVTSNRSLLSYPTVAPIDTVFGRYILQLGTTTVVGFCVFGIISTTLRSPLTVQWAFVIEAAFAGSLLALGNAFINNVMFTRYPLYQKVFEIITRPLFMLSGVFYLPDEMPHPGKDILLMNPVTHIIMLFRKGFYPEYRASGLDTGYLYSIALTLLFVGLAIFSCSRGVLRGR